MKSIKFLAAMAIPAMFAACTSEALVDNTPQKMNEVVGAELVGSGISMNATIDNSVATRITANGKFETTDKLGLGWIVNGQGTAAVQNYEDALSDNKLYANDLFQWNGEAFATTANIYKGWHFAYYPYTYMEEVGNLQISFNKPQTSKDWKEMVNDYFYISSRKFLTKDSLNQETHQLQSQFNMVNVYNTVYVMVQPADYLKTGKFKDKAVKSITFNHNDGVDGTGPFTTGATLNVHELPQYVYGDYTADSAAVAQALLGGKVLARLDAKDTITTNVEAAGYKVGENMVLRMIQNAVAGSTITNTEAGTLSFDIEVEGGKFHVGYVEGATANSVDDFNNKELLALATAYKTNGKLTGAGAEYTVRLKLEGKHFTPAAVVISDLTEWNSEVATAEALGRTETTFTIDDTISFVNEIPMPANCKVNVVAVEDTVALQITGTVAEWPANLASGVKTVVAEGAIWNLSATPGITKAVYNYGTINLTNSGTALGKASAYLVENNGVVNLAAGTIANQLYNTQNGRVNIQYGAYVNMANNAGIVAYTVTGESVEAKNIQQMIVNAALNTLVINDVTLDLNATWTSTPTEGDAYVDGANGTTYNMANLENVDIEMYGGKIVGSLATDKKNKVGNVTAFSGRPELWDVLPGTSVDVKAGASLLICGTADQDWESTTLTNAGSVGVYVNTIVATWKNTNWIIVAKGATINAVTEPSKTDRGSIQQN